MYLIFLLQPMFELYHCFFLHAGLEPSPSPPFHAHIHRSSEDISTFYCLAKGLSTLRKVFSFFRAEQLAIAQKMEDRQASMPGRNKVKRRPSLSSTLKKHKFVSQDRLDESSFGKLLPSSPYFYLFQFQLAGIPLTLNISYLF